MLTLIYSQLIFCTIGYNFIYKGALGLSQLFFSCGTLCLSAMLFLISVSFAPIFPFPQGYLYPCYVPALFTPCSTLFFFFLSALHSIFCSVFCSSSSLEGTWSLYLPPWNPTLLYFSLQTLVHEVEVAFIQVSPLRQCCPSQSTGEAPLNVFALQFYPCWGI